MRRVLANVLALTALVSCSVYDASLLSNSELVASDGGAAPLPSRVGTGGVGMTEASGAGGASQAAGNAGLDPAAGTAGLAPSAGTTGTDNSAGAAGTPENPDGSGGGSAGGGSAGSDGNAAGSAGAPPHELATGKPVTASTVQPGNDPAKGNDHDSTTRWCASDATMPQWWRVDLGVVHPLQQVSIQFEHPERKYSYVIESSQDDKVYTQQVTASGTGALQTLAFPAAASGRYVRITVTAGAPGVVNGMSVTTWASFFELSLLGL